MGIRLFAWLQPKPVLTDAEVAHGLRMMTWEAIMANALYSVTTSGLLAAFALALGANSFQIGALAAIPFLMQPIQIPTILLVEKLRLRKAISVLAWFPAQSVWIPIALIPVLLPVPSGAAVYTLLGLFALRAGLAAVCNCAWFGWVRDLVPPAILGTFHAKRLAWATVSAIIFGIVAALFVDVWRGYATEVNAVLGYTIILLPAAIFLGLADPFFMSRMPEPTMAPPLGERQSLTSILATPLKNGNFRRLANFLFLWGFASNLATPFFAVYMLTKLGFPVSAVMVLSVLSQIFNALFLRVWGPLVDRFGSKAVLSISVSLYLLVIVGWVFTAMPEPYILTIPLVIVLHVFAGIATAGLNLTVNTIGYKLAPTGEATAYLAGASLATSIGAGLSPLIGGWLADMISSRDFVLSFGWGETTGSSGGFVVLLSGFDFLFIIAFLLGSATLNALALVVEEGEGERAAVMDELYESSRVMTRGVSSVPGLRFLANFPYAYLRHLPGADVALGVTSYQISSVARATVKAAVAGEHLVHDAARQVNEGITHALEQVDDVTGHSVEIAAALSRGALHALDEIGKATRRNMRGVVSEAIEALGSTPADPMEVFWGVGYGMVQGADETGVDLGKAATSVVDAVRAAAAGMGVDGDVAAGSAMEGVMQAAIDIGEEAVAIVTDAMPTYRAAAAESGLDGS
jgi:MFS family permease